MVKVVEPPSLTPLSVIVEWNHVTITQTFAEDGTVELVVSARVLPDVPGAIGVAIDAGLLIAIV